MLFMGEEWGETQPFPFFCDFQDDLAEAVRNGRRGEFARFPEFSHPEARERIPDPISPATFASAKLRWGDIDHAAQRTLIDHYKILLAIRHREVMPRLPKIERGGAYQVMPSGAIQVKWQVGETELLTLVTNLRPEAASYESVAIGHVLWKEGDWDNGLLSPWFVQWSVSTP
jgi:1,4-alpha-glucan branching enzyme